MHVWLKQHMNNRISLIGGSASGPSWIICLQSHDFEVWKRTCWTGTDQSIKCQSSLLWGGSFLSAEKHLLNKTMCSTSGSCLTSCYLHSQLLDHNLATVIGNPRCCNPCFVPRRPGAIQKYLLTYLFALTGNHLSSQFQTLLCQQWKQKVIELRWLKRHVAPSSPMLPAFVL